MFPCVAQVLRQETLDDHRPEPLHLHHAAHAQWDHPSAARLSGPQLDQHIQEAAQLAHQPPARYKGEIADVFFAAQDGSSAHSPH